MICKLPQQSDIMISCPILNLIVLRPSDFTLKRKKWRKRTIRQRRKAKMKNISRVERTTFWPPTDLNSADLSINNCGPYIQHIFFTLYSRPSHWSTMTTTSTSFKFWARALRKFSPAKPKGHAQYGKLVLVVILVLQSVAIVITIFFFFVSLVFCCWSAELKW